MSGGGKPVQSLAEKRLEKAVVHAARLQAEVDRLTKQYQIISDVYRETLFQLDRAEGRTRKKIFDWEEDEAPDPGEAA